MLNLGRVDKNETKQQEYIPLYLLDWQKVGK